MNSAQTSKSTCLEINELADGVTAAKGLGGGWQGNPAPAAGVTKVMFID